MAFWIVPKSEIEIAFVCQQLLGKGIKIMNPENFSFTNSASGFRLGYASLTEQQMEEGIIALSEYL